MNPLTDDNRTYDWPDAKVATVFVHAVESGRLDVPYPGSGQTRQRWAVLADLTALPAAGGRWGVWAAQPPGPGLSASNTGGCWYLNGIKRYCSGARSCTDALVTAAAPDRVRLFAVSTHDLSPDPGSWPAVGMAGSDTLDVSFGGIWATPVGGPCRSARSSNSVRW